jgi:hypothetical protein
MLHNLLDAAMPTPIDLITFLFVEQPIFGLFVLIPLISSLIGAIVVIVLAARRENEEDRRRVDEYTRRMGK